MVGIYKRQKRFNYQSQAQVGKHNNIQLFIAEFEKVLNILNKGSHPTELSTF